MKVLHLIGGGDVGGARVHVLSLVKELGRFIDVKIISFRPGMFADEARSMGINIEVVKSGNIFADISRVIRVIRREKYEIIHSHGAKANMIALAAKLFTRLPTVTTVHSDYRLDYLESLVKQYSLGLINMIALRFIDYYIGVSRNFRDMLISRNFKPSRIFTVYNGIDFEKQVHGYSRSQFSKKYGVNLSDDDIVVGVLARLYPVKGLETLINAADAVLKANPSVKFIIGGDGEDRQMLEDKVAGLGLRDSIFFPGWIDDPYECISILDINVLTSISESFPYSILEGALLKKATISSDVGGISDLIENGCNGYLFEPGDHEKLARYILMLVNDAGLRKELGEKIYEKARTNFSLLNMCTSQLEIYGRIKKAEEAPDGKPYKRRFTYDAIISGYYGSGNIGDDAILTSIVNDLRTYKNDIRLLVMSRNPLETKKAYGIDSISRTSLTGILCAMKRSSLFINGGGSLIQDITSTRSLIYFLGTIWLAKKFRLKVMFYANGIGPVNKPDNRRLTQRIVNRVDVITLRENQSFEELSNLNISKPRIIVTADPALTIEPADSKEVGRIFDLEGIDRKGPFVGISARGWGEYQGYKDVIAAAADYMIEKYGVKCIFIPMHFPGDLAVTECISRRMKNGSFIIRNRYSGSSILGIIKRMEMLVGMRLHALIFAASAGVPMIGLEYEKKVGGFLEYINQAEQASAGHVESLDPEALKGIIDNTWAARAQIRNHLAKITPELKDKALQNARIAVELIEGRRKP